jgi:hypothetical protein
VVKGLDGKGGKFNVWYRSMSTTDNFPAGSADENEGGKFSWTVSAIDYRY